jgi:signal peptidase I
MEKKKKEKKPREKGVFREYFELIAETAIFVFFVMTFVVQAFQIPTGSMEPTLLIGDFLLVNKMAYAKPYFGWEKLVLPQKEIERHDIIVFKYPREMQKDYVKRVIALEGEKIEIRDKQVYVNDKPIAENYKVHVDNQIIKNSEYYQYDDAIRDNFGPVEVPAGQCLAMGDEGPGSSISLMMRKGMPGRKRVSVSASKNSRGLSRRRGGVDYFESSTNLSELFIKAADTFRFKKHLI